MLPEGQASSLPEGVVFCEKKRVLSADSTVTVG
jgi:hypothetical protein